MSLPTRLNRRWLAAVYLLVALTATWQRGVASREHTTFAIFRQSYVHLSTGSDLYALYPDETGAASQDRFKYSPSAAMLLAPLAQLPYAESLLVWNLMNVGVLFFAIIRVFPRERANLGLLIALPEVFTSVQASSSNALIAAMMLLSASWLWRGRVTRAAILIAAGAAIKVFPLAVLSIAVMRRKKRRLSAAFGLACVVLALLPLLSVSAGQLLEQYRSWKQLEVSDALDVEFGMSFIRALRTVVVAAFPNWALQLIGVVVLLQPLTRRDQWSNEDFQRRFTASLLMFVVLFNHQAERQSMVIAAAGCALWLVAREPSLFLAACYAAALTGASVVPYAVLWIVLQLELAGHSMVDVAKGIRSAFTQRSSRMDCRNCRRLVSLLALRCSDCASIAPALSWQRLPVLTLKLFAFVAVTDGVTPGHYLLRWNLWDLLLP